MPGNEHIQNLIQCIDLEEKEQARKFSLDQQHPLKALKAEGLALHPIVVTRKNFGYADYPEISFRLNFPPEANLFRDGSAIECFSQGEEPIKGILLNLEGKVGEFRLFAPDFPDWIEDDGVGIKLAPDTRSSQIMKTALKELENNKTLYELFERLHAKETTAISQPTIQTPSQPEITFKKHNLNDSQKEAVKAVLGNDSLVIVHGPPGTGKTTTISEAIFQLVKSGNKVLGCAPSNTAVDHLARVLINMGLEVLRVGNSSKVDATVFPHTPEGRLSNSKQLKEIRQLRMRAEEFRRMALKYKRSFGKAEREQRNLLFKEVKNIRTEIKKLQAYNEEKLFESAQVILGTPVGLYDNRMKGVQYHTLVLDEAGQCIEPLAWCVFPLAERIVLAGDHWQLPPTVLSAEAAGLGLNRSILELAVQHVPDIFLLNTQYRMREAIAGFSSEYFYKGLLKAGPGLENTGFHVTFIDTAGSGFEEKKGNDGSSLQNEGELNLALKLFEAESLQPGNTAFISPYSGQVELAKQQLPQGTRISTIDSFQGQEKEIIIVSLVRSNDDGEIGFLKDYRRMNVAITRAREHLYIIGDSATLGADVFYNALLTYIERNGSYRTCWEFDLQ